MMVDSYNSYVDMACLYYATCVCNYMLMTTMLGICTLVKYFNVH